ncbi:MAG: hypothetical protein IIA02_06025 [Proteobacteria bacterium]|uniref:hypothetical protein n=1 Tax=Aquabacterium sp. TaxID=1872578 RepID=UPI0035C6FB99|nr:hypothetical protein [Pseudomonadota bacterium]
MLFTLCRSLLPSLSLALMAAAPAHAQGVPIDDEALSQVYGQAMFSLSNTSVNGFDFSRITLNADVQLAATLGGLRLGEYSHSVRNGTGADIDIGTLQFGNAATRSAVAITDPYVEFVYRNVGNAATREVVGMRLGFGSIKGDIGLQANAISGALLINAGGNSIDSSQDPLGGVRWDGSTCAGGNTCAVKLSDLAGVKAGDSAGGSRDFFISVLKTAVNFPTTNAALAASATAQAGFWLNWRDRLNAVLK